MYWPYFSMGCSLEMNSQRTTAYLNNVSNIALGGGISTRIDARCECPPLSYIFDEDDVPQLATYTTPAGDQAPWFDSDIAESARFLGFIISDVVFNAVAARSITTRISSSGGGSLGPIRNKERRLDFDVLMFACDEISMEYGFRYLTDALASSGCDDGCTLCDAEYRESCPPIQGGPQLADSLNKGRWILKNVGLVDGPVWGETPVESAACNMRRVKFSLVSEMPWKFKCPVVECDSVELAGYPSAGTDCDNWDEILCGKQEVACSVSEGLIIGETGLIISVTAGSIPLQHIQIAIRPDAFGYEADPDSRPVGYVRVEPCDLIYIPELPASHTLVYDTSIESIKVLVPGGGTYDATPLIATAEGRAPTFPTLRCGNFCVSVAVSECSVEGAPTVTVSSVHREL